MNTETYLAKKKYCNKCINHKHIEVYPKDIYCDIIKRRCFDYEFNHKGIEFGTINIKEVQTVIDAVNKRAKGIIVNILEKEFPKFMPQDVPKSLPLQLKRTELNELKFENEEMQAMFDSLMKHCFLNQDFNCPFYIGVDK